MARYSICLTVGTLNRQFDRLLRFFSSLELDDVAGLVQYGGSTPTVLNVAAEALQRQAFTGDSELSKAMNQSHLVIAHAGVGTIIQANSLGKPLVLLPRLLRYEEHFDDHQLQIANVVKHIPGIAVAEDSLNDFRNKVMTFLHDPPIVKRALGGDQLPQHLASWATRAQGSV